MIRNTRKGTVFIMDFLPYLLAGLSVGSQYALIAIGYTMVYGILRLINFAHGDLFMVAGILMVYVSASMPWYISIPLVLILTAVIGFTIERCAYAPLRSAPRMSVMVSAIGVSYLLQNLVYYVTGGLSKQYPELPLLSTRVSFFGIHDKLVIFVTPVIVVILMVLLMLLINRTKIGLAMRAAAKDFSTARLMGIRINRVISTTFVIGSFLAAVGSVLYFSKYTGVQPSSGGLPGLKAFVAAVFGGIGSIPGAVVGGILIGLIENIAVAVGLSTYKDAFTFILLIIILVVKPTGLFGEKATEKV